MRVAALVMTLCLAGAGVLIATPPARRAAPKPVVRVTVEHRVVQKVLPRQTIVKRVSAEATRTRAATPTRRVTPSTIVTHASTIESVNQPGGGSAAGSGGRK